MLLQHTSPVYQQQQQQQQKDEEDTFPCLLFAGVSGDERLGVQRDIPGRT